MQLRPTAGIGLTPDDKPRDAAAVDRAARELEGAFARLLISSLRQSSLGEGDALFPGAAGHYRDLYDAQLAQALTQGRGLGLQAAIRRQLQGGAEPGPAARPAALPLPAASAPLAARAAALQAQLTALATPAPADTPATSAPGPLDQPASVYELPALRRRAAAHFRAAAAPAPTPEEFVARLWPQAQAAAAELGVPARLLLAQAALETGWGRHLPRTADGNTSANLFGIKAGRRWAGATVTATTTEVENGRATRVPAPFRAYGSTAESFADYVALLKNSPRYADTVGTGDGRAFAQALQRAGYATDPDYAAKLTAIAEGPTLRRALAALAGTPAPPSQKV